MCSSRRPEDRPVQRMVQTCGVAGGFLRTGLVISNKANKHIVFPSSCCTLLHGSTAALGVSSKCWVCNSSCGFLEKWIFTLCPLTALLLLLKSPPFFEVFCINDTLDEEKE